MPRPSQLASPLLAKLSGYSVVLEAAVVGSVVA